jgi:hypothetical protein
VAYKLAYIIAISPVTAPLLSLIAICIHQDIYLRLDGLLQQLLSCLPGGIPYLPREKP